MGEAELTSPGILTIGSHFVFYGEAASALLAEQLREEVETLWNEAGGRVVISGQEYGVQFRITSEYNRDPGELEVLQNTNPRNNYFRIEEFVMGNISFVDGIGSNTGYFKLENLYPGSTTAAHEYGHTIGLDHPPILDIRGRGVPGIMYPRGTLVDPPFQYDPSRPAGVTGGTMHPMHRKVMPSDIQHLQLHRLPFRNRRAIVGEFSNIYHWNHAEAGGENSAFPGFSH
ncbi:MAG TPA: peptidase M10 [Flavisolibacter sp.]